MAANRWHKESKSFREESDPLIVAQDAADITAKKAQHVQRNADLSHQIAQTVWER